MFLHSLRRLLKARFSPAPEQYVYDSFAGYEADRQSIDERHKERSLKQRAVLESAGDVRVAGHCYCCGRDSVFTIHWDGKTSPNWREEFKCERCGLNTRLRGSVQAFEKLCKPWPRTRIYATEYATPFFEWLLRHYPNATGSEFSGIQLPVPEGIPDERWARACRTENVTALSFPGQEFDAVLSFDVLEHVPDYRKALGEFFRVLKPGGRIVLTAPFIEHNPQTIIRARIDQDGVIEHLLPPEYHGDPISDAGCLCYYHFGWDLLDEFSAAGFEDVQSRFYWSMRLGYPGNQHLITARRPRSRAAEKLSGGTIRR